MTGAIARELRLSPRLVDSGVTGVADRPKKPHNTALVRTGQSESDTGQTLRFAPIDTWDWYVYFVEGHGLVKIGRSVDPIKRLVHLQIGSPVPLDLVRYLPCGPALEGELHRRFTSLREAGEWFRFTGELRRWVEDFSNLHLLIAAGEDEPSAPYAKAAELSLLISEPIDRIAQLVERQRVPVAAWSEIGQPLFDLNVVASEIAEGRLANA